MTVTLSLVAYAIALLAVAVYSYRRQANMEEFLVADRNQKKLFVTASMLASTIGGGITIGTVQKASTLGFCAFWFVAAGAFAHFAQGALLSRKVRASRALTLAELAEKSAVPAARTVTSLIVLITWIGIAASQFVAVARVLGTLVGLAHEPAVLIAAVTITVYTLIGGQKSVLRTDLFQFGVLAIAVIVSLIWLYAARPPAGPIVIDLFTSDFGPIDLIYYIVVMGGSYFICPMMFSRLLSADTADNARKSSFFSGGGMLVFAFIMTFIGLWARASGFDSGGLDPLNAIAKTALPTVLGVLLVFGLLAAIVSTSDTVLFTAGAIVQNDLIKKPSVGMTRLWISLVALIGMFIAVFETDIIGLIMKTYNGYTAGLVPALFVALMYAKFDKDGVSGRRPNGPLFVAAIVIGYAMGMGGSFSTGLAAQVLPLAGIIVSAALALLSFLIAGKNSGVHYEQGKTL